jgi:hypothetical protein
VTYFRAASERLEKKRQCRRYSNRRKSNKQEGLTFDE